MHTHLLFLPTRCLTGFFSLSPSRRAPAGKQGQPGECSNRRFVTCMIWAPRSLARRGSHSAQTRLWLRDHLGRQAGSFAVKEAPQGCTLASTESAGGKVGAVPRAKWNAREPTSTTAGAPRGGTKKKRYAHADRPRHEFPPRTIIRVKLQGENWGN